MVVEHDALMSHRVELGPHEATEGVLRRADNGLAAHIKAGVDQDGAAGFRLEAAEQRVEARVDFGMDGLDARRIIDVGHGGNVRASHIELFDTEERLLLGRHPALSALHHVGDQQHVWAVAD